MIYEILGLFLANAGLILWMRSESRADWRQMDSNLCSLRQETNANLHALRQETNAILHAIQEEVRDFHGRLCAIEERKKEK